MNFCIRSRSSQKSPIPKDRFEEVLDAASLERPTKKTPTKIRGKGKALYSFRAQNPRYSICEASVLRTQGILYVKLPCSEPKVFYMYSLLVQNLRSICATSMLRIQGILQCVYM